MKIKLITLFVVLQMIMGASLFGQFDPNKTYKILNSHGGRALCTLHNSADPANKGNQEPIIQYDYYGDATQHWKIRKTGDITWSIINVHSGKALCTMHNSGDPANKGNQEIMIQYDYYGDATQNWVIQDQGNGAYSISNRHLGRALCTMHNSGDPANKGNQEEIIQFDYYGDATQRWRIEEVGGVSAPTKIKFVGTNIELTPQALKSDLAANGLTLVQTNKLQPNQCAVINPTASTDGNSVEGKFGCLVCATKIGENVELKSAAIYGGCDASAANGAGAACEIGVASSTLEVNAGGQTTTFNVKGPSASACGSVSTDRLCANAGANWASTSVSIKDVHGNGVGIGVDAGVGAGINGSYEGGVLSFGVGLKFIAGGSITFSVNPEYLGTKVIQGGSTAIIYTQNKMVAVGSKVKSTATNLASDIKSGTTVAAVKIGQGASNTWGTVTNEVSDWGNSVGAFFSMITNGAKLNRALAPGEAYLSVFNQSGYVVTTHVDFQHPLGNKSIEKDLSLGMTAQFFIPPGATNINMWTKSKCLPSKTVHDASFGALNDGNKYAIRIKGSCLLEDWNRVDP